jgi:hypothetical protein
MAKKEVCSTALVVGLALLFTGVALAQRPAPTATIHEQGLAKPTGGNRHVPGGLVPAYCSPCSFYGGDGDPNNANADGLWDNNSAERLLPYQGKTGSDSCSFGARCEAQDRTKGERGADQLRSAACKFRTFRRYHPKRGQVQLRPPRAIPVGLC